MEPLAAVTRNGYVESIHYGYICLTDSKGKVLHSIGDPSTKIYFRSSAKPIQVIPLVQSGAAHAFNFTLQEIALACASHSGQEIHQKATAAILHRLGLSDVHLHCGTMLPSNRKERQRLLAGSLRPTVYHCSCSGKHAAMLALAKYRKYPLETYDLPDNPVQQEILATVARFAEEEIGSIDIGSDGCGVPVYLLPIRKIALAYAKLMDFAADEQSAYHEASSTVVAAMNQYPKMVRGEGEFCTELMQAAPMKLIGKFGSEAVYCIGLKEGSLGICIKIADGSERALYPVVIHVLRELGVLTGTELAQLEKWAKPKLQNNLKQVVGEIIPVFSLKGTKTRHITIGAKAATLT